MLNVVAAGPLRLSGSLSSIISLFSAEPKRLKGFFNLSNMNAAGPASPSGLPARPEGPSIISRLSQKSIGSSLRSEEHTSELQSRFDLVCRLLLEKKKTCGGQSHTNSAHD